MAVTLGIKSKYCKFRCVPACACMRACVRACAHARARVCVCVCRGESFDNYVKNDSRKATKIEGRRSLMISRECLSCVLKCLPFLRRTSSATVRHTGTTLHSCPSIHVMIGLSETLPVNCRNVDQRRSPGNIEMNASTFCTRGAHVQNVEASISVLPDDWPCAVKPVGAKMSKSKTRSLFNFALDASALRSRLACDSLQWRMY